MKRYIRTVSHSGCQKKPGECKAWLGQMFLPYYVRCCRKIFCLLLSVLIMIPGCVVMAASVNSETRSVKTQLISDQNIGNYWCNVDIKKAVAQYTQEQSVAAGENLNIPFDIPAGNYRIAVTYRLASESMLENQCGITLGNYQIHTQLSALWHDKAGEIPQDRYENEVTPEQEMTSESFTVYLSDQSSLDSGAAQFPFVEGNNVLQIMPESVETVITAVYIMPLEDLPSYNEYLNSVNQQNASGETTVIQGEDIRLKSDSYIRAKSVRDTSVEPNQVKQKLLNALDESSYHKVGQKALWEFEVDQDGLYGISFKYNEEANGNMSCFRTVEIDGAVPYIELKSICFPAISGSGYKNLTPTDEDGNKLKVFLKKGIHTIALTVNASAYNDVYTQIKSVMSDINSLGMSIKKLVGNNTDNNRTWDVEDYLPNIYDTLNTLENRCNEIYSSLRTITKADPTFANSLKYAISNFKKLKSDLSVLPNKLSLISEGDGSVAQALGDLLPILESQPIGFDKIYITGSDDTLPSARASFLKNISNSILSFIYSFNPKIKEGSYGISKKDNSSLNVWVNRPVQYVEVMQQMTDSGFTKETGIKVKYSIMPNEQKLILANAAKTNPDVALGVMFSTPFEFAIRGAAKNLLDYDGFLDWYNSEFNLESLTPMSFNHGAYGVSETQNFIVLFYRKDILDKLGLSVPQTWDDVSAMMPVLLRNGMNFNIPASNMATFKNYQGVSPFVFQNGGEFYSATGTETAINSAASYNGLKQFTDLYKITSLQTYIGSFYNSFRYGQIPIGVAGFSEYLQLQLAAPELAGKWDIALAPGNRNADGEIERYQMADGTASMIFANTEKSEESYQFLKWWMSSDTQVKFAYTLQNRYGPEYRWNTSNIKAFEQLPYSKQHRDIILQQWTWQKEVMRHPAGYMVEREVSNIWNNVVVMNRNLRSELDGASIRSNREILRKLDEFGYLDSEGNVIQDYPVDNYEYFLKLLNK